MSEQGIQLRTPLKRKSEEPTEKKIVRPPEADFGFADYVEFGDQPKIPFEGLLLALVPPLLVTLQIKIAAFAEIPILEYLFVGILFSFLLNYYLIRKHDLMPFLPDDSFDKKLKFISTLGLLVFVTSIYWGWNGSGGIIFAVTWEIMRQSKMGNKIFGFAAAIIGSVLLQGNYESSKLYEFIPGILIGYIASTLFTLKKSSTYSIYHQFSLITTIFLPIFFPIQHMIRPSLMQWLIMLVGGLITQFTSLVTIKSMQNQKPSIGVTVFASILILLTSSYVQGIQYFYAFIVVAGTAFLIKKQYYDEQQQ